jgi:adenosylhomocysteine nucleosidase
VVVLFALEREAAPFRRAVGDGVRVEVSGVGLTLARRAAERVLAKASPRLLVMAGFCGALRAGLAVGDVVVPAEVVDAAGGRWACAGEGRGSECLLTARGLVATPAEKAVLAARHRADVVDMESAAVAAACAGNGVPFAAVRAVSDAVDTALSPQLVKLLAGGTVSPLRAAAALVRQPSLLGEFRRLARDTRLAAQRLADALVKVVGQESPGTAVPGL